MKHGITVELTIQNVLAWLIHTFRSLKFENPELNSELILSNVLNLKRTELHLSSQNKISEIDFEIINRILRRRIDHEPFQYIFGKTDFFGYPILVDRNVLIPRSETELLVEKIINENSEVRTILEIGTGSGAIAIALAKNLLQAKIDATDISEKALQIAMKNALKNKVEINFINSDLFKNVSGKYDLIVSNPPYISKTEYEKLPFEIRDFEPKKALIAEENGLFFYKKILAKVKDYLTKNGKIYFEIGFDQAERIKEIALINGFTNIEVCKDFNGFDRIMRM